MKILLVDDNDAVRKVSRHELERRGFGICDEGANGIQAIAKAREMRPDLILLDRSLPDLGRASVAPVLRTEMPGVAIILMMLYAETHEIDALSVDWCAGSPTALRISSTISTGCLHPGRNHPPLAVFRSPPSKQNCGMGIAFVETEPASQAILEKWIASLRTK